MNLWRPDRADLKFILLIVLFPILVATPLLLGLRNSDPAMYMAGANIGTHELNNGAPVIDGNNGGTMQAIGYRAAEEIIHGRAPWWNAYSGVGLPLAAEFQPSAFFPLTMLLLLPQGMLWEHLLLQMLAGVGAFALLRQLGLGRLAAFCGGTLLAFNGTMAWYQHAGALTLPFLPWMLLGIERAWVKASTGVVGGWRIFAVALALDVVAGFPESAYINGLLALTWAVLRLWQSQPQWRPAFAWRIALGGSVGVALASPQIFSFLQSLPISHVPLHDSKEMVLAHLDSIHVVPNLIAPYVFGPIFKYASIWPASFAAWGGLGGYVTASVLVVAAYGAVAKRSALTWTLLIWILLALGKSYGLQPAVFLWNLVPGIAETAVDRYIPPTWSLALAILAAHGVDDLIRTGSVRRGPLLVAALVALIVAGASLGFGIHYWSHVRVSTGLRLWTSLSLAWAVLSAIICVALFAWPVPRWSASVLSALLIVEAAFMFAVPTFSNPTGDTKVDMPAIDFLRRNLGFNRFYTLGPIWANYSAYYGIASINQNYVPIPLVWTNWERTHLDNDTDALLLFYRNFHGASGEDPLQRLDRNIPVLEWTGVKYVVTDPKQAEVVGRREALKKVYADAAMDIFQLPKPAPYFEILSGHCTVETIDRMRAAVYCTTPATLLRRELYYPEWTATVNGADTAVTAYKDVFQAVDLAPGRSVARFHYAPPHVVWMWLAAFIGGLSLVLSVVFEFRPLNAIRGSLLGPTGSARPPTRRKPIAAALTSANPNTEMRRSESHPREF